MIVRAVAMTSGISGAIVPKIMPLLSLPNPQDEETSDGAMSDLESNSARC